MNGFRIQDSGSRRKSPRLVVYRLSTLLLFGLRRPFSAFAVSVIVFGWAIVAKADEVVTVTDTSGRVTSGTLNQITGDGITVHNTQPHRFATAELIRIQFGDRQAAPLKQGSVILLENGDRLLATPLTVDDDSLTARWIAFPDWVAVDVPLETIRGFVFDLPRNDDLRNRLLQQLQKTPAGHDVIILQNGDRLEGQLEGLDVASLHLQAAVGAVHLERSRVRAVGLNPELVSFPQTDKPRVLITLIDGTRLTADQWTLTDSNLTAEALFGATQTIPLSAVVSLQFFSENVVSLSELDPAEVRFTPYLSRSWEMQRDRNVLGGPLAIRGVESAKGLGVHSQTAVTYLVNGEFRAFQATIGIDDSARGSGGAIFGVELDGRRVYTSEPLTGRSPAVDLPLIPLSGAKHLTLTVEFGPFGDIADHADWCDPLLIR